MKMKALHQNLQNTAKTAFQGKYIALNVDIRKEEKHHTNNLRSCFKSLEDQNKQRRENKQINNKYKS